MKLTGVLFFPVTPFDAGGRVAASLLAEHIYAGLTHSPGAVFVACGTGEFAALSLIEHHLTVRTAVVAADREVPVIAGAGGPLGLAKRQAAAAGAAGADGLLLMPPCLAQGPPAGLHAYVEAVAEAAAGLPVILYRRGGMATDPAQTVELARIPGVVGLQDGIGDIDMMARIMLAVRREIGADFTFVNGLPTAELTAPAYRAIGVNLYASATFTFAPQIATAFRAALDTGDTRTVGQLVQVFYGPLSELCDRVPGYAVSLVKAAVRIGDRHPGPVRPPLTDPGPGHLDELADLITAAQAAL